MALSLGKGAACAGLVLALAAASVGAADPVTTPSTIATPPAVSEVGGKTLAQWIRDLERPDPSDREEAVRAITLFGPAASEAVPELVKRLHDSDASPRCKAVIALGFIKINDKDRPRVVEALGAAVAEDSQAMVRYAAAVSLGELGADAKGARGTPARRGRPVLMGDPPRSHCGPRGGGPDAQRAGPAGHARPAGRPARPRGPSAADGGDGAGSDGPAGRPRPAGCAWSTPSGPWTTIRTRRWAFGRI